MSQKADILAALKRGETLTRLDCLKQFRCFEAGARITELRKEGWNIKSVTVARDGKWRPAWMLPRMELF